MSFLLISSLLVIASATDYGHGNAGYAPKPDYSDKPKLPKPTDKLFPIDNLIGIEGFIFCKSGSKHFPLEGAKARIKCVAEDVNGYESIFSTLSCPTDVKGYFFTSISPSSLLQDNIKKLSNCKTILEESPLETCNIPTDVNKGITGYSLDSFRFLHNKKMNLFSVPSLFYTCQPHESVPNNGRY
ncbi:hypothetical protein FNV43_RR23576 [Rhamnella rubrinervis]|uniref:Uncharacterized protein n=1 Tax=Rhamnella rubrinervis TaxID=2594499 RepID=A0A8K0DYD1_9ROSA|nr:hypothetical protein FNV43_RR23576 [Rhamnella rubrinervis]